DLDIVGLARRLSCLFHELANRGRTNCSIIPRLCFLEYCQYVPSPVRFARLAAWVSRNGSASSVAFARRAARSTVQDRSESARVASLAAKSSKCLSVSGDFFPTFTSDRS